MDSHDKCPANTEFSVVNPMPQQPPPNGDGFGVYQGLTENKDALLTRNGIIYDNIWNNYQWLTRLKEQTHQDLQGDVFGEYVHLQLTLEVTEFHAIKNGLSKACQPLETQSLPSVFFSSSLCPLMTLLVFLGNNLRGSLVYSLQMFAASR